jgi:S-adenosylmethionine decarboxylase
VLLIIFLLLNNRSEWDVLLKDVQCSIISVTKTDKQEAYVLR